MSSTRISTKGQIVLPSRLRHELNWPAGTRLEVERHGDTVVLRPRVGLPEKTLKPEDIVGVLKWTGEPSTIREMDAAVDDMFRRAPQ